MSTSNDAQQIADLQLQVQQLSEELKSAQDTAAAATAAAAEQHARVLQDSQEATEAAEKQLASLKDVIRTMSADRTTAEGAAGQMDRALNDATAETVQLRATLAAAEQETAAAAARGDAMVAAAREEVSKEAAQKVESLQSELDSRTAEVTAAKASLDAAIEQSRGQEAAQTAAAAAQLSTAEADAAAQAAATKLSLEAAEATIAEKDEQMVHLKESHLAEVAAAVESSQHAITATEEVRASNSNLLFCLVPDLSPCGIFVKLALVVK